MPRLGQTTIKRLRLSGGSGSYILLPSLTTTQRDALSVAAGMVVYNSTTGQVEEYNGSTWRSVGQAILTTHEADFGLHNKIIRKTADEIVSNSAVLQNDDELLLPLGANESWAFLIVIRLNSTAVADFSFKLTAPAGAVGEYIITAEGVADSNPVGNVYGIVADGSNQILALRGVVVNGSTAGNLQLQWSQNTAEASDTKVLANSYIIATLLP